MNPCIYQHCLWRRNLRLKFGEHNNISSRAFFILVCTNLFLQAHLRNKILKKTTRKQKATANRCTKQCIFGSNLSHFFVPHQVLEYYRLEFLKNSTKLDISGIAVSNKTKYYTNVLFYAHVFLVYPKFWRKKYYATMIVKQINWLVFIW